MARYAFTLLELIFVIVIMGILSKYGFEFLNQAYRSFIFSSINNALQSQSEFAVESIASRLQYRIKDSVIARLDSGVLSDFQALAGSTYGDSATVLEWIGTDVDGFRGNSLPLWSGVIDLNPSSSTALISSGTNTVELNSLIDELGGSTLNDAALYFVGSESDIQTGYGWDGNTTIINTQNGAMHPINSISGQPTQFAPASGTFSGVDVYEYYQLAWTAYAVVHTSDGNLTLHYDYQPWKGENYNSQTTKKQLIMQNVDTFRFKAVGSILKIQVCVNTDLVEDYSLCKEKTIF